MNVWLENSEKLGVASLQIQEQFKNVQQEHNMLKGQVADLEQQLVLAESQLEEFRVRIEANDSLFVSECQGQQLPLDCESTQAKSDVVS